LATKFRIAISRSFAAFGSNFPFFAPYALKPPDEIFMEARRHTIWVGTLL
jgi:hypothetical protein